ncbi:MAG: hypothetical protein IKZ29_02170 [Clostridiales bacterium]|nr:hypothetical protein [Clostridiales bacterium]
MDVFILITLINSVRRITSEKGRRPGGYIAMTVILWVVPEIIGLIIGFGSDMGLASYVLGFLFAGAGGALAYFIVRNLKPGNYVSKNDRLVQQFSETYEPLRANCRIIINRISALSGASVTYEMYLNDRNIGTLINGSSLVAMTDQRQNILVAKVPDSYDVPPFIFEVPDGGCVQIQFQGGRFIPESSIGLMNFGKNVTVDPNKAVPRSQPADFTAQPAAYAAPNAVQPSPYVPASSQPSPFVPAPAQQSPFVPAPVVPTQYPQYQPAPVYVSPVPTYAPPAKKAPAVSKAPIPDDPTPVGDATPIHYVRNNSKTAAFPSPVEQPPIVPPSAAAIWGPTPTYNTPAPEPAQSAPAADAAQSAPKFCDMCGSPLPGGTKFCGKCGARIDEML